MKVARGQSVWSWTPIDDGHWKMFGTVAIPWEADVYELAPGVWGASAENTVTHQVFGTVDKHFDSADEARAAVEAHITKSVNG